MKKLLKKLFLILLSAVFLLGIAGGIVFSRYNHTSADRPENLYSDEIPQLQSKNDKDKDGIDDQTDILQSALAYTETKPKYLSRYYDNGYPDDGYGVCTDLVANALKGAGYDLMEQVQKDIQSHAKDYDIDTPDKNIDFRRVKNLRVYFSHTAKQLTTDTKKIEEWQGGDIVIFEDHIGIVSDRRNKDGVPYVIHHHDPWQGTYEEDILQSRDDLTEHFRISE